MLGAFPVDESRRTLSTRFSRDLDAPAPLFGACRPFHGQRAELNIAVAGHARALHELQGRVRVLQFCQYTLAL
jgi:hypothetical protein